MSATYSTSLYTPPPIPTGDLGNIPDELRPYFNWVNWAYRANPDEPGRWDKQIIYRRRDGRWCWGGPTWPEVLVDFYTALSHALINEGTGRVGLGFCLTRAEDTPFTFNDYDKCHDPATGVVTPWALALVQRLNTFTEISPSGRGLHQVVLGKKPGPRCHNRGDGVELYDKVHFIAMTGWRLPGTPATVEPRQAELDALYHELFPAPAPAAAAVLPAQATPFRIIPGAADDLINRARQYVCRIPGGISGQYGSARTVLVACKLILDFALPFDDALTVLREWNKTCTPPWTDRELQRRLEWADRQPGQRGRLANAERLQPWEEEIADLIGVPITISLRRAPAPAASPAAAEATGEATADTTGDIAAARGDDGANHRAAWEDPRDSDRWAKELPCPNLRQIFMLHRRESTLDCRAVDCHARTCVACRHNAKRKHVLNLRHGLRESLPSDATVHVFTTTAWSRRVWRRIPGQYALVKRTDPSTGATVGCLVISIGGPPSGGIAAEEVTQAEAIRRAEAAVACYAGRGGGMSFSREWERVEEPRCTTGCWRVVAERSPDLPTLTRPQMAAFARDRGVTCERREVPRCLKHRFRASIHRFTLPAEWDEGQRVDFAWRLSRLGDEASEEAFLDRCTLKCTPGGFIVSL
jgi:hypothetical protein